MLQSQEINELASALAEAQKQIKPPPRNRSVKVRGVNKRTNKQFSYDFKYTTFDAVIEAVRKPLTDNGLWFTQVMGLNPEGQIVLVTRVMHKSGQWVQSVVPVVQEEGGHQQFGSALTYMRRYALSAALGIAAEEDDDANSAEGNEIVESSETSRSVKNAAAANDNQPSLPAREGDFDYLNWGIQVADRLERAEKPNDIGAILTENQDRLEKAKTEAPSIHKRLMTVLAQARARLANTAQPQEASPLPIQLPAGLSQEFLGFLNDLHAKFSDVKTRASIDKVYEANRAATDALSASDFDIVNVLYEWHIDRVGKKKAA